MKVKNTKTMFTLLSAIKIRPSEMRFIGNGSEIELLINLQQLMYSINAVYHDIYPIYKNTDEWKELTSFFNGIY